MKRLMFFCFLFGMLLAAQLISEDRGFQLKNDEEAGKLEVHLDGRQILVYQYASNLDMAHYWPMNSPSGKNMLIQKTEPYPHHRSFWFADTVRLNGGREVSIYNSLYSGKEKGENDYGPPFKDHIRHKSFTIIKAEEAQAEIVAHLVWEMDSTRPVLDEKRRMVIYDLGNGEYLLDIFFELFASYGEVEFVSDNVHYAWPYLRLHPQFSGENGGTITSDKGARGQENTNMKEALWIDYSSTVDGTTEGVTVFQWPDGQDHKWLTREYGTFGPRRTENKSGKPFMLKQGESIGQRVGILVHRGGVKRGRIAERYQKYIRDNWQ